MREVKYQYFRFLTGRFFRMNPENYQFEVLNEEMLWEENSDLISIFFDAASEYYLITDPNIIAELESYNRKSRGSR